MAAVIFTTLVLGAVNVGWWWYYSTITVYLEKQLSHRLTATAAAAALHITPETVDGLLIDNLDRYAETHLYLDSLTVLDSLSETSIIDLDFAYLVSSREDTSLEGYLLSRPNFDDLQKAASGTASASALYDIDGTYLKSAYAPLYGGDGVIEAIMVVEAGAGYFELLDTMRRNLYLLAGGSAATVIFLLFFYIVYNRRMASAEEQIFRNGSQAALGRMVAVVSHEIKNPMMIIRAAGERIEKKYEDPESSFIIEEISRLDKIVSGYLSFARGDSLVNPEKVDLGQLARKITTDFSPQFTREEIALHIEIEDSAPVIMADPVGMRQVIINLLLNALQAAGEGETEKGKVVMEIGSLAGSSGMFIRVANSGRTIKPSQREKLFEPFFTTKVQGSGLGLYLCRRIVEAHGGTIRITDNLEKMTVFEVTLPNGD
ncbi:MAG: hypothetical protein GY841_09590 [FCB group bacterium]|nr:hypothetical protein [FCB group bacterium]